MRRLTPAYLQARLREAHVDKACRRCERVLAQLLADAGCGLRVFGHDVEVAATACAGQLVAEREVVHHLAEAFDGRRVGARVEPFVLLPRLTHKAAELGEVAFLHGVVQGQRVVLHGVELSQVRTTVQEHATHDFGKDLLPSLIGKVKIMAHRFQDSCVFNKTDEAYWRDVGTVDAYWEANIDLTNVVPDLDLYDSRWPIWTFQEQHPAAKFVFESELRTGMAVKSLVSAGCIISGSTVRRSLLFSSVRVHSFALVLPALRVPSNSIEYFSNTLS